MSAACCTGRFRHTTVYNNTFWYDGNVSEGFYASVHCLIQHVCKVKGAE